MVTESESTESMDVDEIYENSSSMFAPGTSDEFQSANKLLEYLPYAEELNKEAEIFHGKLRTRLGRAIISKNIQLAAASYTKSLFSYLNQYGYRFTKEQHIGYIKLYFELLTMEECPLNHVSTFCNTYTFLLKKCHLLTRDDLTLSWRPLYDTLDRCIYHRKYTLSSVASKNLETNIKTAIMCSNKYFHENTMAEVLEAFKPLICPSTPKMFHCLDMLKLFLPYFDPTAVPEMNKFLEFLLEIYSTWNNNPSWEWNMFGVLGFASWHMIGKFDWDQYLPSMYSRLMNGLYLPVYFKGIQNTPVAQSTKEFDASSAARWIIGTLGNKPEAIKNLKNFVETVETYYNPLNMGRWSIPLASLLNELVSVFTVRLKRERYSTEGRYWWLNPPDDRKLTDSDIDEFVQMTSELVLDFYLDVTTGGFILKNLACIRPERIITAVTEKYESMVETVTEPRKYLITMRWVTIILVQMASFRKEEDGYDSRSLVIPFALSLLPTITCNDMQKTLSALGVIHNLFNLVPFVDCSALADSLEDETERKICLQTSCLEDFSLQFLDSILALVESKTHENTRMADHRASMAAINIEDLSLEKLLWAVCHRLAVQSSTSIVKSSAKKIVGFGFSKILETDVSGRMFCSILHAFVVARPDVLLPKLVRRLCNSIESLISDDIVDDEDLDKHLIFQIQTLSCIVETTGTELLKYKEELSSVLTALLKLNGKIAYDFTCHFVRRLLSSLVQIHPLENRISEADFDDPNYLAIKDWGLTMAKKDIRIQWHVPTVEELECAKEIFLRVFVLFSSYYEGIEKLTGKDDKVNKSLLKNLRILTAILDGLQPLLPFWDNQPLNEFEEYGLDFTCMKYSFGLPEISVTVPGTGQNIKEKYFEIFSGIKTYLDKYKPDDTECYIQLIKGFDDLIFLNAEVERRMALPGAKNIRTGLQNVLKHKRKASRSNFVARVYEFHLKRLRLATTRTWSLSHMAIMNKMFELSVNHYARVRIIAQSRFCRMVDTVGSIITMVVTPLFIERLKEGVPHDEYKGTLYTILSCKSSPILANSWPQLRNLWVALLKSPFSEKNSIIKCMDALRKLISQSFIYYPLQDTVSPKAIELATPLVTDVESIHPLYKLHAEQNEIAFHGLVDDLLCFGNLGMIHWRQHVLCINMLSVLIVEHIPMPEKMVEYFYESLISPNIDIRNSVLHTISWFTTMLKRKMEIVKVDTCSGMKFAKGESFHTVFQYKSNEAEEGVNCGKLQVFDTEGRPVSRFYAHKMYYGYLAFPPVVDVKLPPTDYTEWSSQPEPIKVVLEVSYRYFTDEAYVQKLLGIFTQEEKGGKSYGNKRTRLFIAISRNLGPEAVKVLMKFMAPLAKDKDQWKQRCAADILSGTLYGVKLWNEKALAEFWANTKPTLNECLDSVTQETLTYWSESMNIPTSNRDPNMMRFFVELLKERWALSLQTVETTSVSAFKNMNFFENTVNNLHWRGSEIYHEIFSTVQKYFLDTPIPYVNVRDLLGRLMGSIFEWGGHQPVKLDTVVSPEFKPFVDLVFDALKDLVPESAKYMASDKDSEDNDVARKILLRFKSVLELMISLCWDSETNIDPTLFRFIPLCCHFESYDADPELKSLSGASLSGLARTSILAEHVDILLSQLEVASNSSSWRSRLCVVEFLKVFALTNTNVFASSEKFSEQVMKLVLSLLLDRNIEVRESSSKLLGGFLHSLIVQNPTELLESFQRQARSFSRKLQSAAKKVPRQSLSSEEIDAGHSAILGLCAFVDTYPYDVPAFLPNVLITLSNHLHDPQPIPTTLRKCLSNFRRTHHDNWAFHKTKFSEDQLLILTDIFVSPCYYA